MGKHVYLDTHNAEELLPDIINFMKNKVASDSRVKSFEDCTNFWKERIETLLKEDITEFDKLCEIRRMLGIEATKYKGESENE
jgi:hypothetical protein